MRIDWSPDAVSDLKSITEYIEQDRDLAVANRVARRIFEAIQGLRTNPNLGRHGRVDLTRELIVPSLPYIAVYRVFEDRLLILSVLHGARKWP